MADPVNAAPPIEGVIETAIYAPDLDAAEQFYATVLGLPKIGHETGPHVFFRVGPASVLLVFNADTTLKGGHLPSHGASGPGHFALGVPTDSLDAWRDHLTVCSVVIEKETTWPLGGQVVVLPRPGGQLG